MANTPTTTTERWISAKFNHSVAMTAWDAIKHEDDCEFRKRVALAALDARDTLYSVRAPTLGNVADKISIWFGNDLFNDDYEMSCLRRVIGDLRRIELQAAGTDEDEVSGRSPEQAAEDAAAWREVLGNYKDEELLYLEGSSPRWHGRDGADVLAVMECRVAALLELPAPNLAGVIFKLTLLWERDRFKAAPDAPFCVEIMRDLNSLTRSIEAAISQHH